MAFTRPTLQQIVDRIQGDFKSGLSLPTILRRSFLDVFSKAFGGTAHTLYGFIEDAKNQFFPDTADEEFLLRWGSIFGVVRNPATFAELNIEVTGTTGGTIVTGTTYQRSDGALYLVQADIIVPASPGTATGSIVADESGDAGNISDGSTVSLTSPVAGVESNATITSAAVEGEDQETIDNYRTRVIERIQQPPAGGKATDYIAFAKTVTGITRVWVGPGVSGEGTVVTWSVEDDESPIFLSPAKIAEVQIAVDNLKPISADHTAATPIETAVDMDIRLKPNTVEVQDAVLAELEDMFLREAQVTGAIDPLQVGLGVFYNGQIPLSKINEAISLAADEQDHVLDSPTLDVIPITGGLATLGTVNFSTLS